MVVDRHQRVVQHHTYRSETEKNRRRDLVTTLRARREQLQQSLKRSDAGNTRSQLFGGSNGAGRGATRETDATADLDTHGLLQLQRDAMQDQDQQLEELEKTVTSTRVRAHCRMCDRSSAVWY